MKASRACFTIASLSVAGCSLREWDFYTNDATTTSSSSSSTSIGTGGGTGGAGGSGGSPACMPGTVVSCYDGPPVSEGVGICKAGTKTCSADGTSFGPCVGQVLPQPENCATPIDEDCDGMAPPCKGTLLWAKRFGNVNGVYDETIAVDSVGNVVLAGFFDGSVDFGGGKLTSQGGGDIFVVKLDANGQHIWSKSFGDASSQFARGVAVDSAGNVLVTGTLNGSVNFGGGKLTSQGGGDIFVVKLDANGQHIWSKSFGDSSAQEGTGLTSDGAGAVVLTGYFLGSVNFGGGKIQSAGGREVFIVKFDANGQHVWSKHSGGDIGAQQGTRPSVSIATDATTGDLVVAGAFVTPLDFGGGLLPNNGGFDGFAAKLDAGGQHVWSQSLGGPGNQFAWNVAVDPAGAVLVTGSFENEIIFGTTAIMSSGVEDVFAAKLGPDGQHVWSRSFGYMSSSQVGQGIAADGAGDVLLTGSFTGSINFGDNPLASAGTTDAFLAKRTPDDDQIWSKRFGNMSGLQGTRVVADVDGNILVTGFCTGGPVDFGAGPVTGSGSTDVFVAKYSP